MKLRTKKIDSSFFVQTGISLKHILFYLFINAEGNSALRITYKRKTLRTSYTGQNIM